MPDTNSQFLSNAPFFESFPAEVIDQLQAVSTSRTYPKNTHIINQGGEAKAAYLLVEGAAFAYTDDGEGNEFIFNTFKAGDCFGELGLLDDQPRSVHVLTTTDCECLVIPKDEFQRCVFTTPDAASATIRMLIARIRSMTDEVSCLAMLDVYGRIARLIQNSSEENSEGKRETDRMTHQEIASRIGSSREMVSKIIKDLTVGGYISSHKSKITLIKDLPKRW